MFTGWSRESLQTLPPAVEVKPTPCASFLPSLPSLSPHLPVRNCFRVSSRGRSKAHPYSLQANDSFSKQQWITCLRQAIVHSRDKMAQTSQSQLSSHPDPVLYHIADLSLSSNTDMAEHSSHWLFVWRKDDSSWTQKKLLHGEIYFYIHFFWLIVWL